MGRGIDGVKIFRNKADREDFPDRGIESAFGIYEKGVGKERRYSYAEKNVVDSSLHNKQSTDAQSSVHFDGFLV